MEFERTLSKIGSSSLMVTIPIDLVKFLDLQEGSTVIIAENSGIVTLRKKPEIKQEVQTEVVV